MKIPQSLRSPNLKAGLFPAGVPLALVRLKQRVGTFFEGAPLFFIGVVLAVAVLFRVTVRVLRPAEDPTSDSVATTSPAAPHSAPTPYHEATSVPVTGAARGNLTGGDPSPIFAASPNGRAGAQAPPAPARRKPRTHGRR